MDISSIEVGKTYVGEIDWKRGIGTHRTVLAIDTKGDLVSFRVEPGERAPSVYVSHASMAATEFAAWAQHEAKRG